MAMGFIRTTMSRIRHPRQARVAAPLCIYIVATQYQWLSYSFITHDNRTPPNEGETDLNSNPDRRGSAFFP